MEMWKAIIPRGRMLDLFRMLCAAFWFIDTAVIELINTDKPFTVI